MASYASWRHFRGSLGGSTVFGHVWSVFPGVHMLWLTPTSLNLERYDSDNIGTFFIHFQNITLSGIFWIRTIPSRTIPGPDCAAACGASQITWINRPVLGSLLRRCNAFFESACRDRQNTSVSVVSRTENGDGNIGSVYYKSFCSSPYSEPYFDFPFSVNFLLSDSKFKFQNNWY
jgi:hypothetical protein